jgi:hypothetical protein
MSQTISLNQLIDLGFHIYLENTIRQDQVIKSRKLIANVYGKQLVAVLIKQKKYRELFYDFLSKLRLSRNFRDRQMYL